MEATLSTLETGAETLLSGPGHGKARASNGRVLVGDGAGSMLPRALFAFRSDLAFLPVRPFEGCRDRHSAAAAFLALKTAGSNRLAGKNER